MVIIGLYPDEYYEKNNIACSHNPQYFVFEQYTDGLMKIKTVFDREHSTLYRNHFFLKLFCF